MNSPNWKNRTLWTGDNLDIMRRPDQMQISEATVESLLNGSSWPDLPTIARVERNLRRRFWASQQYAKQPS